MLQQNTPQRFFPPVIFPECTWRSTVTNASDDGKSDSDLRAESFEPFQGDVLPQWLIHFTDTSRVSNHVSKTKNNKTAGYLYKTDQTLFIIIIFMLCCK